MGNDDKEEIKARLSSKWGKISGEEKYEEQQGRLIRDEIRRFLLAGLDLFERLE